MFPAKRNAPNSVHPIWYNLIVKEKAKMSGGFNMNAFDKVVGYESIKNELLQICDMIHNRETYEKLVTATSREKIAALAEIGYLPDIDLLQKSRIPWSYYMTWSKEFCIGEKYNSVVNLKKMYDSEYAVTL